MSNSYITLTDSESNAYRYSVTFQGYDPRLTKSGKVRTTITGKLEYQVGVTTREWQYRLRAPASATPPSGTLANLKTLFALSDPNGTPTNVITLTDIDTTVYSVYLMGDLSPRPISYNLATAPSYVMLKMVETTAI